MRELKIGDKVRHRNNETEGYVSYSRFGLSVNGFSYLDDGTLVHMKCQGIPESELRKYFKRVYKFKHDMLRYETEKQKETTE